MDLSPSLREGIKKPVAKSSNFCRGVGLLSSIDLLQFFREKWVHAMGAKNRQRGSLQQMWGLGPAFIFRGLVNASFKVTSIFPFSTKRRHPEKSAADFRILHQQVVTVFSSQQSTESYRGPDVICILIGTCFNVRKGYIK